MAGIFTVAAATGNDFSKGSQYPGTIVKAEIRADGEDASQWQDLGAIGAGSKITFTNNTVMAQGKKPIALNGYEVACEVTVLSVTAATATALDKMRTVGVDLRVTCIGGDVYTLLHDYYLDGTPGAEDHSGDDGNNAANFKIQYGGTMTPANYIACRSTPTP